MTYDVMSLCTYEDGTYQVDPSVMVPATVAHIKAAVAGDEDLAEIVTPGWTGRPDREPVADRFLSEAEKIPPDAWDLALIPYSENSTEARAYVLGFVESWWKRALALESKKLYPDRGVVIHINKNLDYRR